MSDTNIADFVKDFITIKTSEENKDFNTAEVLLKFTDKNGKIKEFGRKIKFRKNITLGENKNDLFFDETYKEADDVYMDDRFLLEHIANSCTGNTVRAMIRGSDSILGYKHNEILEYFNKKDRR